MPTICQFFRLIHVEIEGLMINFAWQITCCGHMNKKISMQLIIIGIIV